MTIKNGDVTRTEQSSSKAKIVKSQRGRTNDTRMPYLLQNTFQGKLHAYFVNIIPIHSEQFFHILSWEIIIN